MVRVSGWSRDLRLQSQRTIQYPEALQRVQCLHASTCLMITIVSDDDALHQFVYPYYYQVPVMKNNSTPPCAEGEDSVGIQGPIRSDRMATRKQMAVSPVSILLLLLLLLLRCHDRAD